uniref:Uncharacterized protein n=1 Tax=Anopheles braziliensis TaxID=58242 RepID=A0A2M3ZM68_9DIPT
MLRRLILRVTVSIFLSVIIMLQSLLGTDMQTPGVFLGWQEAGKPNASTLLPFPSLFIHKFLVRIFPRDYLSSSQTSRREKLGRMEGYTITEGRKQARTLSSQSPNHSTHSQEKNDKVMGV